jgi:hypothetical protein
MTPPYPAIKTGGNAPRATTRAPPAPFGAPLQGAGTSAGMVQESLNGAALMAGVAGE